MARPAGVFVRDLTPSESERLVKITRTARGRVRMRQAGIVLASTQGRSAADAAAMFAMTAAYARQVIHAFNTEGFAALDPKWSGGRPAKFGPQARETIARIAKTSPQQLDLPFTTWSLSKLARTPRATRTDHRQHRDGAPGAAHGRDLLAGHQDLERARATRSSPPSSPGCSPSTTPPPRARRPTGAG